MAIMAFAVLPPLSAAQIPTLILDDPAGDTSPSDGLASEADHVDILQVRLHEDIVHDAIGFEFVTAGDLPPIAGAGDEIVEYNAEYRIGTEWRRVQITAKAGDAMWSADWRYQEVQEPGAYGNTFIDGGKAEITVEGVMATVPRATLSDVAVIEPRTIIEDLHFTARRYITGLFVNDGFQPVAEVRDRAPDDASLIHEFTFHIQYTDDLMVYSPTMVRASNGGATTVVFPVKVEGKGPVDLALADVPAAWNATLPVDRIDQSDVNMTIPLVLTADFQHRHGKSETVQVKATNEGGTATASFGIKYLDFPQPAGHHSALYLHAVPSGNVLLAPAAEASGNDVSHRALMSTRSDYPGAEDEAVAAEGGHFAGVDEAASWTWRIPLEPSLAIGMDPDADDVGSLDVALSRGFGGEVAVSASFQVENEEGGTRVLFATSEQTITLTDAPQELRLDVTAADDAPVPYQDGSQLWLVINATGTATGADAGPESIMYLHPGGSARLPLEEYRDPITSILPPSDLRFSPAYIEGAVRPGSRTAHQVELRNDGDDRLSVYLIAQANGATVEIDESPFTIAGNGRATRDVVVTVEDSTAVVAVAAVGDDGSVALLDLVLVADEAAPEGRSPDPATKSSPSTTFIPLCLLVLLAAWQRSRR